MSRLVIRNIVGTGCAALAILCACTSQSPTEPKSNGGGTGPNPDGVLLLGTPSNLAHTAIVDMTPSPAPVDETSGSLLLTRVDAVIAPTATVGEVNQTLTDFGATIISMRAGELILTLKTPQVADLAGLRAMADSLAATPAFLAAIPGVAPHGNSALPGGSASNHVDHFIRNRMVQAWNAKAAILPSSMPDVIVVDQFSSLQTPDDLSGLRFVLSGATEDSDHGISVASVIAADFDADLATGAFPRAAEAPLSLSAVLSGGLTWRETMDNMVVNLPEETRALINVCIGYPGVDTISLFDRAVYCLNWKAKIAPYLDRVIVVSAAGNRGTDPGEMGNAVHSSFVNAAASVADVSEYPAPAGWSASDSATLALLAQTAATIEPLTAQTMRDNHIIVGNVFANGTVAANSSRGATAYAEGSGIDVLCTDCSGGLRSANGTSFAAPQITGLIAYLWSTEVGQSLTPARIRSILSESVSDEVYVDAYDALLAVDHFVTGQPIRSALMDITTSGNDNTPDGAFDEFDLERWSDMFTTAGVNGTFAVFSRYDLNGDSTFSSSDSIVAPFELDADFPPVLETALASPAGEFDENAVSDVDCLCYYAYSSLYDGDDAKRDSILWPLCGTDYIIALMTQDRYVAPGDSTILVVGVGRLLAGTGDTIWIPNAEVSLIGSHVTLQTYLGNADADGQFVTWIRLDPGADSGFAQVTGLIGGDVLATNTISIYALAEGLQIEVMCDPDDKSTPLVNSECPVRFDNSTAYVVYASTGGPGGTPVEGAQITVEVEGGTADPVGGTTDADGFFHIVCRADSTSPEYKITVQASAPGGQFVDTTQILTRTWEGSYISGDHYYRWCEDEPEPNYPPEMEPDSVTTFFDHRFFVSYRWGSDSVYIWTNSNYGLWTSDVDLTLRGILSGSSVTGTAYQVNMSTGALTEVGQFAGSLGDGILDLRFTWGKCGPEVTLTRHAKFRGRLRQHVPR